MISRHNISEYVKTRNVKNFPRIPLEGNLDLTYRCNNNCRHCWLRIPAGSPEKENELTFDEIRGIVEEARKMGCRKWNISGGEPMLRPDFIDIFDYITKNSASYSINTNGTLITFKIAKLMRRKGVKMIALYGATADIHDHITRTPGSFERVMEGIAYLKEARASFTIQLIPMRGNYHQFEKMKALAESLISHWKIGASWLFLSASGDAERNKQIASQRLDPSEVVVIDKPDLSYKEWADKGESHNYSHLKKNHSLFLSCIGTRRDFHIDPYGHMGFCCFIKNSDLRYDLRRGNLEECWNTFIPSLADKIKGGKEYQQHCGSCSLQDDCKWCPVYGYLEHKRFTAKVEYLCEVAKKTKAFKETWGGKHRCYYHIGGITIQVDSDLPITDSTFHPKFRQFQVNGPGKDNILIRHHFSLPDLNGRDLGKQVYRKPPWAIYRRRNCWVYLGISTFAGDEHLHRAVVFTHDHSKARIYNAGEESFRKGNLHSLTLFPTDQILLGRVLADREGCYMHSSGVIFDSKGLLFVGHSHSGKSTIATILKNKAEILCDDRVILRKSDEEFKIYGTWSHGELPEVSAASAPLKAIMFLDKAKENCLKPIDDKREIILKLLSCIVRPFVTADWWEKMLELIGHIAGEVPCYHLHFDKSGKAIDVIQEAFGED